MFHNLPPWLKQLAREVLIALLVSLLGILGYDGVVHRGVVGPHPYPSPNLGRGERDGGLLPSPTLERAGGLLPSPDIGRGAGGEGLSALASLGKTTNLHSLALAADLSLQPQAAISVTAGAAITPTGALQPLTSAANVTATLATGAAMPGDLLLLTNSVTYTIALSDTGALKLAGDGALGQYDALLLVYDGARWIELARSDN